MKEILKRCLWWFHEHIIHEVGIGCVSEIFDGDAPHIANGCINQAWSVAELIRLLYIIREINF